MGNQLLKTCPQGSLIDYNPHNEIDTAQKDLNLQPFNYPDYGLYPWGD